MARDILWFGHSNILYFLMSPLRCKCNCFDFAGISSDLPQGRRNYVQVGGEDPNAGFGSSWVEGYIPEVGWLVVD